MYEEQNIMTQSDYEPYLLSLYPTQTTTIIDTDYDSYAVIYNCGTLLAGFLVFDDYIVLSKNSVNLIKNLSPPQISLDNIKIRLRLNF